MSDQIFRKKITRRDALRMMAGTVGAGVLSACGGAEATSTSAPVAAEPTAAPVVSDIPGASVIPKAASGAFDGEITFAIQAGPEADAHTRNVTKFNELAAPLQVRVEEVGRDVWLQTYQTNFQSQSDAWDAQVIATAAFKQAGPAGWLVPVEEFMGDSELFNAAEFDLNDWPQAIRDLFTIDGVLYEFPQEASANMFFYRKDLVDKWGLEHPPEDGFTWDALIENARAAVEPIKSEGLEGEMYPLIFSLGLEQIGVFMLQTMWSYGGDCYIDDIMPNWNAPEGKQALADLKEWYDEGLMSPGCSGFGYSEVLIAMQQGGGVYMPQWNASAPDLLNPDKSPITAGNMAFSIFPYHKDVGPDVLRHWPSVWALGISKYSKHPDEAFSYISWFTSKDIARDYVLNGGGSSGRTSLLTDPEILAKNPQFGPMLKGLANYHADASVMSSDYLRKEILSRWANSAIVGEVGTDEALDKATEEAITYLKDQGEI